MTRTCIKIGYYRYALRNGLTMDAASQALSYLLGMVEIHNKEDFNVLNTYQPEIELYEADCISEQQYEEDKAIQEKKEENPDA